MVALILAYRVQFWVFVQKHTLQRMTIASKVKFNNLEAAIRQVARSQIWSVLPCVENQKSREEHIKRWIFSFIQRMYYA